MASRTKNKDEHHLVHWHFPRLAAVPTCYDAGPTAQQFVAGRMGKKD